MIWERGKGRVGRGHCARCFTPTLCANPRCGCHVPQGITCRADGCTAGLFVAIPADNDREVRATQAALLDLYGYTRKAA